MICSDCGEEFEDGLDACPRCGCAADAPDADDADDADDGLLLDADEDGEQDSFLFAADADGDDDGVLDDDDETAEIEAALRSLDEIKHTAAKPHAAQQIESTTSTGFISITPDYSTRRKDARIGQLLIAMAAVLGLAVLLFFVVPNQVKPGPSWTPTIAEKDPDAGPSPVGDIAPIEELSAQDHPDAEAPLIAFDAYDHPDKDKAQDESGYIIPDSDTHAYTVEEIQAMQLSEWDLEIARNEIYARHGRGFNDSTIQAYFDRQDWYERTYSPEEFDSQSGLLSQVELENISVIGTVEDSM